MEKKNYINNIIQAANKVLECKEVVNDLSIRVEAVHYGIDDTDIGTLDDILYHCSDLLSNASDRYNELKSLLNGTERYTDITLQMDNGWDLYYEILYGIDTDEDIKNMPSEDIFAIRSIMGQVELLRDTLIWVNNQNE